MSMKREVVHTLQLKKTMAILSFKHVKQSKVLDMIISMIHVVKQAINSTKNINGIMKNFMQT